MNKRLAVLVLVVATTLLGTEGCASSWWQNIVNNPVAAVQSFDSAAENALTLAQTAWSTITPLLPASALVVAQPKFTQAMVAARAALAALEDGVQAAIDAKNPSPDFQSLMQAVSDAVVQVETIVSDFQNPPASATASAVATTGPIAGVKELATAVAAMKHAGHTK
jgi:hypothetical protein